jgi:signal transduction histidine kinase
MSESPIYSSSDLADRLRREFYEAILSQALTRPEIDFRRLTDAWRVATNADWVWLWLKNPFLTEKPWELRELSCDDANRSTYLPPDAIAPSATPVAEYCALTGKSVYVENLETWKESHLGRQFAVACAPYLREMGCRSFLVVPFRAPPSPTSVVGQTRNPHPFQLDGAVCAHFRNQQAYVEHPVESLKLMARLTALTITTSFKTAQQEILLELNQLAHDYVTRISRRPINDRKTYLLSVIALLKRHLAVKAVSIFYDEEEFQHALHCVCTTGIADVDLNEIREDRWDTVVYRPNEGLTGQVYASGQPIVLSKSEAQKHSPRYVEVLGNHVAGRTDAILYPIPRPLDRSPEAQEAYEFQSIPLARGVIRCSDHDAPLYPGTSRPFDPVDVETLAFIARQISPILETLTVRIRREQTISVIKHDLFAPLGMIRDIAEDLAKGAVDPAVPVKAKYYDVMNIGACALFAGNLVHQLDPEPDRDRHVDFSRTLLEKTIVAPIKNMLAHYASRENDMSIHFDGFRDIPPLWIDQDLIERVFINLLVNAIKYGKSGTTISVIAKAISNFYRIDISNEGQGVADDDRDRIFERGYRSQHVKDKKLGIGLGLYIARSAVESHGGKLLLSQAKDPTTFSILLPEDLKRGPYKNGEKRSR